MAKSVLVNMLCAKERDSDLFTLKFTHQRQACLSVSPRKAFLSIKTLAPGCGRSLPLLCLEGTRKGIGSAPENHGKLGWPPHGTAASQGPLGA